MFGVIFSEYEIHKITLIVHNGKRVEFMLPDNVVRFFKRRFCRSRNQFSERSHKIRNLVFEIHPAHSVISARNDTEEFTIARTVVRDRYRGKSVSFFKIDNVGKRVIRREVRCAHNETRFIIFNSRDHSCFVFNRLRAVNKTHSAFFGERDC